MDTPICQTCSSNLLPAHLQSAFFPTCCKTPICNRCIQRNPRLCEYVPCLRCGDPRHGLLAGGATAQGRRVVGGNGGEVVFEIGEDEDDDEYGTEDPMGRGQPPAYDDMVPPPSSLAPVQGAPIRPGQQPAGVDSIKEQEREMEQVEVRHGVLRGDTLMGIAKKYAADPHEIMILNNIPPSALTTHPRILQTRKTLIISRRSVPSCAQSPRLEAQSQEDAPDKTDEARRRQEREIKKFQLLTKSTDPSVARTYLSLSELSENHPAAFSGEALSGKKAVLPEEGNRQDRAVDRFWDDEEWEQRTRGERMEGRRVGKWKVVGGSGPGLKMES